MNDAKDMPLRRRVLLAALAALPLPARAQALPKPTGRVVLSVVGKIGHPNAGERADFDMAMLERLPQASFTTRTPWYPEAHRFTGPRLRDVLAVAGAQGTTLRAIALNDYKIEIPAEDAQHFDVIAARLMDGKPMPVREKGPLFVVYPFDSRPELQSEKYYARSAWQLRTLEVR
jgi:hypothetical protein